MMTDTVRRIFCAVLMAVGMALAITAPAKATEDLYTPAPEEWLFEVVMPPFLIADGVVVYQWESRYYLPVTQMALGLEFYIEPSPNPDIITGWFLNEDNSFTIDAARQELILRGERQNLPADAVLSLPDAYNDDVYLDLDVLNEIFPVTFQVDLPRLSINVEAEDKLAFQARLERRERREVLEKRANTKEAIDNLIPIENTYRWISRPVIDLQATYNYDEEEDSITGTNIISGSSQLLGTVADFSASFDYENKDKLQRPDNVRLRLRREAYDGKDMILGLQTIEAGDVNLRQRDLIDTSTPGRGVRVTSERSRTGDEFDRITLEGNGPPGWEIEIFNNNELITFGEVAENGEYLFEDIALRFGNNRIRIVLYGPQGQVREEVRNYNIGGAMQAPGSFTYSAGFVDADRDFILLDNDPRVEPRGLAANAYASYGLTNNLTLFTSATRLPTDQEDEQDYLSFGTAFSALGGIGSIELYKERDGGTAVDTRFLTSLYGVKLSARNAFFNDFNSPDTGFDQNATTFEGEYEASRSFPFSIGVLGLRANTLYRKNENDVSTTEIDTQQTFSRGGIRLSHSTDTTLIDRDHQSTSGIFNTTIRHNKWQIRGNVNYDLFPERELTSGQVEVRYREQGGLQGAVDLRHNFLDSGTQYGAQIGYDFGSVLGSFDTEFDKETGWEFILRASTSLNPYGTDGSYQLSSQTKRSAAPYRSRVFLDRDGDNQFTPGIDEPISEAFTRANNGRSQTRTDEDGLLIHELSGRAGQTAITIDPNSLGDPYYRPTIVGYDVHPLIGTTPFLEFPIIETGAIDGTLTYETGRPVAGLTLQLLDAQGALINSSRTAYDGFFNFDFVKPGTYTLQADPKHNVFVPPRSVTVSLEDPFVFDVDLQLSTQAPKEQAAAQTESGVVAHTHIHPARPVLRTNEPASSFSIDEVIK